MSEKYSEEIQELLITLVRHYDDEDRPTREYQLRHYRRLKLYWNNFNQIFWSESARDYRIVSAGDSAYGDSTDQEYYDRPVNVFRAFLETIIAALAIQVPNVQCVPDDADNPNDIMTAKAGTKIAELIFKHNDLIWIWLQGLYIHCTEGMVAGYCYTRESDEYGTYSEPEYKDEEIEALVCPHCMAQVEESIFTGQLPLPQTEEDLQQLDMMRTMKNAEAIEFSEDQENKFDPDNEDVELNSTIQNEGPVCPECGQMLDPNLQKSSLMVPRFVGNVNKPKSRVCIDVYGGLYVKVANYAKKQCDTPYLRFAYETNYVNAIEEYEDLRDKIPNGSNDGGTTSNDPYAQQARLNPQYRNAFPIDQVTVSHTWLRPASFNYLTKEQSKLLRRKFPNGAKVSMVNDLFAEACNQDLDDHWTLTRNPLSDYLCHDPLGELLVNIQDIVNDLISLILQTIEHGILQVWADPSVVNFNSQNQVDAAPGTITPTKPQSGSRSIGEAFFTTKAAALAPEVFQFYQIIFQLGQFVSGAMPSIYGGQQQGSETASEYAMSKAASLQRLQTPWRMFNIWWKELLGKAIPLYIKCIKADERYVKKADSGNFINVYIRTSELKGKIGSVELESSDQLPVSEEQKAETVMRLMELNNAEILAAFADPQNLPFMRKLVRIPEFRLPGEDDRTKQYEEIELLLQQQPIMQPVDEMMIQEAIAVGQDPALLQPIELPSIPIDPMVDNSPVEGSICRSWAVSEAGRLAKIENPLGYKNVLLHMKLHNDQAMQQQLAMMQMQASQNPDLPGNKGKPPSKPKGSSEITPENANERTPIK